MGLGVSRDPVPEDGAARRRSAACSFSCAVVEKNCTAVEGRKGVCPPAPPSDAGRELHQPTHPTSDAGGSPFISSDGLPTREVARSAVLRDFRRENLPARRSKRTSDAVLRACRCLFGVPTGGRDGFFGFPGLDQGGLDHFPRLPASDQGGPSHFLRSPGLDHGGPSRFLRFPALGDLCRGRSSLPPYRRSFSRNLHLSKIKATISQLEISSTASAATRLPAR